ncbi:MULTISPECIES: ABC1 kinase family protein [Halomicrobium]|uniref:ABC-1 domain protein n=2 Tax=Halomicrobium mukohataei TaxID=57705 RepID=C7P3P8_HALMD|nr:MULTISPECIES: AarF/ABC1/UbiB kinase family protein [Halomicrobium]ACV47720.1 ABC-1 domain protein [Halomicrobium mukohataei DSM 12286]QCD66173.1 AarF/ABC1/UbiB kinase family protein [Halomicrobium mukohataei]QFR20978.1 AarF/ABC1/UbiB kinase family protein [Halomicrobium sp. ZPS1]
MNLRAYWRFVVVVRHFLPLGLSYARDRNRFLLFGRSRDVTPEQRRRRAGRLLDSLLTLGPTFIKLGQLLSTRPDVLPPEYIDEFAQLQDRVPPAPWDEARTVLEDELGPVDEAFDGFEDEAISGASLGQVYRAEVDGDAVAVKIRRPGIEDLVEADLRAIRWSLPILMYFVGETRSFSLETLADEFSKTIREEMDYGREAEMLTEIRGNFADNDRIRIPGVVETHSTNRVLTMEYLPGTKINDVEELDELSVDRTRLAETLQRSYLQMIIDDGVFHADPHPGNLAVQSDGTLVFYDFGMSGRVDPFVQDRIVDFYAAVASQDIDAILDALIEMGTLSPEADRQVMGEVMELAIADARGEDLEQYRVQQIIQQVEDTIYEFPLRLPANLALVLRVATVVEGVCVTLDPDFDFITVATEYLREEGHIAAGAKQYAQDRAGEVRDAAESMVRVPPKLESALDRIEREDLHVRADIEDSDGVLERMTRRLILGMILASGTLSTALLYAASTDEATAVAGVGTLAVAGVTYLSFRRSKGLRATPQFTRQSMRQRESADDAGYASSYGPDEE